MRARLFTLTAALMCIVSTTSVSTAASIRLEPYPLPVVSAAGKSPRELQSPGWMSLLTIRGKIVSGDAAQFSELLSHYPKGGYLQIESPGGDIKEALEIARLADQWQLHTRAVPAGICSAACLLIWLAGLRPESPPLMNSSTGSLGFFGLTAAPVPADSDAIENILAGHCMPPDWRSALTEPAPESPLWIPEIQVRQTLCSTP